jgi:hypothetical protein
VLPWCECAEAAREGAREAAREGAREAARETPARDPSTDNAASDTSSSFSSSSSSSSSAGGGTGRIFSMSLSFVETVSSIRIERELDLNECLPVKFPGSTKTTWHRRRRLYASQHTVGIQEVADEVAQLPLEPGQTAPTEARGRHATAPGWSVRIDVAGTGLTNRFGRWSNTKKIWEANHTR